jgi:hypothetical protein
MNPMRQNVCFLNLLKHIVKSRIGFSIFACIILIFAYLLTAPFIFPHCNSKFSRAFYKPVAVALEKPWFGRHLYWWYCFDVCGMEVILPVEYKP